MIPSVPTKEGERERKGEYRKRKREEEGGVVITRC